MYRGLTDEPLKAIFIFVEYSNRIGSTMGEDFFEVSKILKPEYMENVVLIVTKMDLFQPEKNWNNVNAIEEHIRDVFAQDFGVSSIIFSHRNVTKEDLFKSMYDAASSKAALKLEYTDVEFYQYFELKGWKAKEMNDLYRMKNKIKGIIGFFIEGLENLQSNRSQYTPVEFQEYVYAAIQQSQRELDEKVYIPFRTRNGDAQLEFDDYTGFMELKKLIQAAHAEVRDHAKTLLDTNPDDTSDWRNSIRRCQYCGEVWVKVSGCDGETTCGAIPENGDQGGDSFIVYLWTTIDGVLRPFKETKRSKGRSAHRQVPVDSIKQIGCGRTIDWKNQAILPRKEVDALFTTQELEDILKCFNMETDFVMKKKQKDRNIRVFSHLDKNGREVSD
ncbi:hypothetical protein ACHAXS_002063 [Conticribra weissflogii]